MLVGWPTGGRSFFEWLDRFHLICLELAVDQVSGRTTSLIQKLLNL